MKTKNKLFATVLLMLFSINTFANFTEVKVKVTGITCSMCSNSVNKALMTLKFVDKIEVDLEKALFIIKIKEGEKVVIDDIRNKIEGAGFSVGELIAGFKFNDLTIEKDFHYVYEDNTYHFVDVKNQNLNEVIYVRFVDKGLTSQKEHKKYTGLTTYKCIKSGKPENCCQNASTKRIYHITI